MTPKMTPKMTLKMILKNSSPSKTKVRADCAGNKDIQRKYKGIEK